MMDEEKVMIETTMGELMKVMMENRCPPYLIDAFLVSCPEVEPFNVVMRFARESDAIVTHLADLIKQAKRTDEDSKSKASAEHEGEVAKLRRQVAKFEKSETKLREELESVKRSAAESKARFEAEMDRNRLAKDRNVDKFRLEYDKLKGELAAAVNERDGLLERENENERRLEQLTEENNHLAEKNRELEEGKEQLEVRALQLQPSYSQQSPSTISLQSGASGQQQVEPVPGGYMSAPIAQPPQFFNFTFNQPPYPLGDGPFFRFSAYTPPFFQN